MHVLKYNLRHSLVVTIRGDICTSVIHHSLLSLWTTISMAGLVPSSIRRRLRHLLFPRSGSKGMGRGSLPKAQLAAHITGHLCALLTLAPLPQVPACFPRALLHLPQILLLQPGAAPRLPSSQHHSCSLGTAHSHTEQLGGGGCSKTCPRHLD